MNQVALSFTAVYLRSKYGYVGFVEELPSINSNGHTIDETRANLRRAAQTIFELEREQAKELLEGKDVVRENFPISP